MTFILAPESDLAIPSTLARARSRLVGTVGTITVIVIDRRKGNRDGG